MLLTQPEIAGWQMASDYRPAREIGGDFFDVFPIAGSAGRRLGLVIADVSGKGISAAILMAFVRPVIRAAMDHTGDPAVALERTNWILTAERPTGLLVTALCGVVDLDTGELRYANAGHEPPLLVRAGGAGTLGAGTLGAGTLGAGTPGGGTLGASPDVGAAGAAVEPLTVSGPLLGAFRTLDLVEGRARLEPDDALVLYTDGVTDAATPAGERFGDDRFRALVRDHGAVSATSVVQAVMAAVADWEGDEPADDLALLVLRRSG